MFIKKIEKKCERVFWYIPGGIVERQDETLWNGGVREVKEETGITLDDRYEGKMLFAYESVTPTRHNMMIFYAIRYMGMEMLSVAPDDEVVERAWLSPRLFWHSYINDKIKSLPSIKLVFQHFIQNQFSRLPKALVETYELHKKRFVNSGMVDEFLLDLCFLEVEGQCTSGVDVSSLIEGAVKLARAPY